MKRICVFTLILVVLLSGCGEKGVSTSVSAETANDQIPQTMSVSETSAVEQMSSMPPEEITINLIEGVYIYDIMVPEQAAYYHSDIFTATVEEIGENYDPYWEPEYIEKHGEVSNYDPCFTKYKFRVGQVIKGDLQTGQLIDVRKLGYYDEETGEYTMVSDDVMPEVGKEYLFLAILDPDTGRYCVSAPNTTIPLDNSETEISTYGLNDEPIDRQAILERYTLAYENQTASPGMEMFGR